MITDASGVCDGCDELKEFTILVGRQQKREPGTARLCQVCLLGAVMEFALLYGTGTKYPAGKLNAKGVEKR